MKSTYRLDFSDFNQPGTYYLKAGKAVSPRFPSIIMCTMGLLTSC